MTARVLARTTGSSHDYLTGPEHFLHRLAAGYLVSAPGAREEAASAAEISTAAMEAAKDENRDNDDIDQQHSLTYDVVKGSHYILDDAHGNESKPEKWSQLIKTFEEPYLFLCFLDIFFSKIRISKAFY